MAYDSANRKLYTTASEGISTSEVAACLGDYRVTARGRDIGLLCTSPKINLWAKYKPVGDPTRKPLKDKSMGYRGNNGAGTCGISYVTYNQYDLLGGIVTTDSNTKNKPHFGDLIKSTDADHAYVPPKGGTAEPYRLLDFDGYEHKATTLWNVVAPTILGKGKPDNITFTQFRVGEYAYMNSISHNSPTALTLIDIMQGLKASGETELVVYEKIASSYFRDYDIRDSKSYGYIGIVALVKDKYDEYKGVGFCSKSVGSVTGDDLNSFNSDISNIIDALGGEPEGTLMLVPVVCNYSTGGVWVQLTLGLMPNLRVIPLPKNKTRYTEYEMEKDLLTVVSTSLSASPTTAQIVGNLVYAPNSISGGLTLTVTANVTGTLSVRFMQNNQQLGNVVTQSISVGTNTLNVGGWISAPTTTLIYKATGLSSGLYTRAGDGELQVELAFSMSGTTDKWTIPVENWAGGSNVVRILRAS